MVSAAVSSETWDNSSSPISEIDVLWITAGLGCDGDTIAMTAATQPCPVQPDNFMETLLYVLYMAGKRAPLIPLDEALRPTWLFGSTVHEGCDRGGYYEQGQFGEDSDFHFVLS
jgi:hypothetical protein